MTVGYVGHLLTWYSATCMILMDKEFNYMELGLCTGARIGFGPRTNFGWINLVPSIAPQVSGLGEYLEVRHLSLKIVVQ